MGGKIGVVICSYDRDLRYVGKLATSLKAYGHYVVIGYDTNNSVPDAATINSCDVFFSGGGHLIRPPGHLRNMRIGHRLLCMAGCDYSLCMTGDAVIENPAAIPSLLLALGDADVLSTQWWNVVGTLIFFGDAAIVSMAIDAIPEGAPQNERKFQKALDNLRAKSIIYPYHVSDRGMWEELGYWRRSKNYPPG